MSAKSDLSAMLAAFHAKGGKVTRVAAGARVMSEKQIYLAQRDAKVTITPIASEGDYLREMGFQAEAKARVR
jgi:anthranilate phosphoribosyltransferase